MKKNRWWWIIAVCLLALLIAQGVWAASNAAVRPAVLASTVVPAEYWKEGYTVETTPPTIAVLANRVLSSSASFRSNRSVNNMYFIFPPAAQAHSIENARYAIESRSGTMEGPATMTVEIYNLAGTLQHIVTSAPVDLLTGTVGEWVPFNLTTTLANRQIASGEFLAVHFYVTSVPTNTLEVHPRFDFEVR